MTANPVPPAGQVLLSGEAGHSLALTMEEIALLRATVEFHAERVADPVLRDRLGGAARKLSRLVALAQQG